MKVLNKIKFNNPRERIMFVLIMLSIFFLFSKYWYSGKSKKNLNLQNKISRLSQKVKENENLYKINQQRRVASLNRMKSNVQVNRYMVSSRHFSGLITELSQKGEQTGLNIEKIQVTGTQNKDGFYRSTIELNTYTTFLELGQFLEELESSNKLLEVDSVNINKIDGDLRHCNALVRIYGYTSQ